jgi:hypothetical protein
LPKGENRKIEKRKSGKGSSCTFERETRSMGKAKSKAA